MAHCRSEYDERPEMMPSSSSSSELFTETWDLGDIVFSVERRFIYANKTVLSMWSPVMKAMFCDDFVERYATVIELPGKRFDDVLELVRVLHPPNKPINDKNVFHLLPMAREYQIDDLTRRCEQFLLSRQPSVRNLVYAEEFALGHLERYCLDHVDGSALKTLVDEPEFQELSDKTRIRILLDKALHYENLLADVKATVDGDRPEQIRFRVGGTLCTFTCPNRRTSSAEGPHNAGTERTCKSCATHMTRVIAEKLATLRI